MLLPRAQIAASALVLGACASNAPPPKAPPTPAPAAVALSTPPAAPGHLARAEVDRVLTTQGPPWLLRRVMSEEVLRHDGKFAGWRLVGLPEEWRGVDLKPGDIVSRVNGLPLETPDQFWEAWKSVAKAMQVKIDLSRDGVARQVIIPIDGTLSADTASAIERGAGPPHAAAPPPAGRSVVLGGAGAEPSDDDAY